MIRASHLKDTRKMSRGWKWDEKKKLRKNYTCPAALPSQNEVSLKKVNFTGKWYFWIQLATCDYQPPKPNFLLAKNIDEHELRWLLEKSPNF